MASAMIVSSVGSLSFRRFLPHEKRVFVMEAANNNRRYDYEDADMAEEEKPIPAALKPSSGLLSAEDVKVLLEAAEQEYAGYDLDWHDFAWHDADAVAAEARETLSLPFASTPSH